MEVFYVSVLFCALYGKKGVKKIIKAVLIVLDLLALFALFEVRNNKAYKDNEQNTVRNITKANELKEKTNNLTVEGYAKTLNQKNGAFNLTNEKNGLKERLSDGITKAYSVRNTAEYNSAKGEIKAILGNLLGEKVLSDTEPTISQASGGTPTAERVNSVDVSFGEYDGETKEIQALAIVDYEVPKETVGNGKTNRKAYYWGTYDFKKQNFEDVAYIVTGGEK